MVSLGFTLTTCPEVIGLMSLVIASWVWLLPHEFGYCLMCFEMGLMDLVIASWGFVTASWVLWLPHGLGFGLMSWMIVSWVRIWTSWVWRLPHGLGNLSHRTKWVWQTVLFNTQYTIYQCCGSIYIEFGSGSWILVQFVSQSKRKM